MCVLCTRQCKPVLRISNRLSPTTRLRHVLLLCLNVGTGSTCACGLSLTPFMALMCRSLLCCCRPSKCGCSSLSINKVFQSQVLSGSPTYLCTCCFFVCSSCTSNTVVGAAQPLPTLTAVVVRIASMSALPAHELRGALLDVLFSPQLGVNKPVPQCSSPVLPNMSVTVPCKSCEIGNGIF